MKSVSKSYARNVRRIDFTLRDVLAALEDRFGLILTEDNHPDTERRPIVSGLCAEFIADASMTDETGFVLPQDPGILVLRIELTKDSEAVTQENES